MSLNRPNTTESLLRVDGVSERQCERFGQRLADCVKQFCEESGLASNKFPDFTDSARGLYDSQVRSGHNMDKIESGLFIRPGQISIVASAIPAKLAFFFFFSLFFMFINRIRWILKLPEFPYTRHVDEYSPVFKGGVILIVIFSFQARAGVAVSICLTSWLAFKLLARPRGNTYLTSLRLVSVRHHGRETQWKSR